MKPAQRTTVQRPTSDIPADLIHRTPLLPSLAQLASPLVLSPLRFYPLLLLFSPLPGFLPLDAFFKHFAPMRSNESSKGELS